MKKLINWIRKQIYGECPRCHSTHIKGVYGWDKDECVDCGKMWNR